LFKYLNHVPATQYEWTHRECNAEANRASAGPGPTEAHALWVNDYLKLYEGFEQFGAVFNGKVFVHTNTRKSIYPGQAYALDQVTGRILYSMPYASGAFTKLDDTRFMLGNDCFDTETGSLLWSTEATVSATGMRGGVYIPELKIGVARGPSVGYADTIQAWDFSDTSKPPVLMWTSETNEDINSWTYGQGKLFLCGLDYHMWAVDVQTGQELWSRQLPALSSRYHVGSPMYDKLYIQSHNGFWCYDQNNGDLLWHSGLLDTGRFAVGFGKVVAMQTRTYMWCWDAYDGHVVWKYLATRDIPHPCGPGAPGECNHTSHHIAFYAPAISSNGYVYATTMQKTTYGNLVPANYEGIEYPEGSGVYYWVNHLDVEATVHAGENEFVCLNLETGEVQWRLGYGWPYSPNVGTEAVPAYEGPDFGQPMVSDGRVYGIEQPYSGHTGVGTSRPELNPGITDPEAKGAYFKPLLANYWRRGRIYCIGPGPSVLSAAADVSNVRAGKTVTFSGSLTDLSPASPGEAAAHVPIVLRWTLPDGSSGIINTVTSDTEGKFTYNWVPYEQGEYTIIVESGGSPSYEAPDPVTLTLNVQSAVDMLPLLQAGIVVLIIVAVAVPVLMYMRRKG
jgi:outer membrane protein assembly factor BamB